MLQTKQAYETDRKPIIGLHSLLPRERWPKAESSKCCIFEAIELVGNALLGPEWSGDELKALEWHIQPKVAEANHQAWLAQKKAPPSLTSKRSIAAPPSGALNEHVLAWYRHRAPIERAARVEAEQELWEENQLLVERLTKAVEWVAAKCRDHELLSYCRFVSGGHLMTVEPHEWNIEYPLARFLSDGTYSRWFVHSTPVKQWDVYVFFDRENLQQAVANLAHAPIVVPMQFIDRLSPYLRLAVKLAIANGYISEAKDETQPIREAEVKAAWNDALPDVPWSETAGQAIAKVMGFPNANAIRQGRQARSAGK